MTTVLIAENDPLHRAFAKKVVSELWNDPIEVVEVEDGADGVDIARTGTIVQAVLDLNLPGASGVDIARALWAIVPQAQVVFWTNFADEAYIRALARVVPQGASYGYVLKSASERELRQSLKSVFLFDRPAISSEVRATQRRLDDRLAGLTDAEHEALTDIALGLTDRVIGERRQLSVRGVQNRLTHLYEKLDIARHDESPDAQQYNPRARAVTLAFQRGLLNHAILSAEQAKLDGWLLSRQDGVRPERGKARMHKDRKE